MKALIVCEGKHERGVTADDSGEQERPGALETIVRRLAQEQHQYTLASVRRDGIRAYHGRGKGFFKRAMRWLLQAKDEGYDILVFLIDEDGERERVRQIDEAQDLVRDDCVERRALGVAIRRFDAWMLADEQALTSVLGCSVPRQRSPESIRDPKSTCEGLRDSSPSDKSLSEMYAAVADAADLDLLSARCRGGFKPFAERVHAL
ncbi:MAG: DUF4276 family protein [Phycisphaerales bacterium]|nr:MAG: DUF4276 family protein [Phycisphaerales bacterium]